MLCSCFQASVMVWASDCLEGARDDEKARLEELKQSTNSCGVPFVSVESRKLLAELVGVCACLHADYIMLECTVHHLHGCSYCCSLLRLFAACPAPISELPGTCKRGCRTAP